MMTRQELAEVPLPEGWTEKPVPDGGRPVQCYLYFDECGVERVTADNSGFRVWTKPKHWPAIPQAVLVRAAVQCHRLREGKHV